MADPAYVPTLVWADDSLVWDDRTLMWDGLAIPTESPQAQHYAQHEVGRSLRAQEEQGRSLSAQEEVGRSLRLMKGFRP